MGRIVVIFIVICLIAAFLYESEAWRRRRRRRVESTLPDKVQKLRQGNHEYDQNRQDDQAAANKLMENEKETKLDDEMETEMETKLDDQKHDSYYYEEEI
ncbi:hypothetical protein OS493_011946 [Desmophyllum pertusum]|nr:hypothetical protein OS493_038193 [Desmophyllum pertusum]KAJ7369548.1 hypothetical protein OS493_038194 [Desmophyllum pertusum]KAJ7369549.1 hypothetical protein OS493_038195 [Desmophyllum pertusum]KAJ7392287.1 hypothetical protein OS493_011943 [Desmophyllum pertusum]KAJ7392288.1 hypothetical protein OS493_011944 [Desmophyllum pertusum]